MKDLNNRFVELVKILGLSYKEFSSKYGIPYSTVMNWKNGLRLPNVNILKEKASINELWFLTGIGDPFKKETDQSESADSNVIFDLIKEKSVEDMKIKELQIIYEWYDKNIETVKRIIEAYIKR